jgi:hypothetical protein
VSNARLIITAVVVEGRSQAWLTVSRATIYRIIRRAGLVTAESNKKLKASDISLAHGHDVEMLAWLETTPAAHSRPPPTNPSPDPPSSRPVGSRSPTTGSPCRR